MILIDHRPDSSVLVQNLGRTLRRWFSWWTWLYAEHQKVQVSRNLVASHNLPAPASNAIPQIVGFFFARLSVVVDVEYAVDKKLERVIRIVDCVGNDVVGQDRAALDRSGDFGCGTCVAKFDYLNAGLTACVAVLVIELNLGCVLLDFEGHAEHDLVIATAIDVDHVTASNDIDDGSIDE